MLKRQKKILLGLALGAGLGLGAALAAQTVFFGPGETSLEGSIKYSVIGKYIAHFHQFSGQITVDPASLGVESVYLDIHVGSIESNCPWCDKLVKSSRLLNIRRYPEIIFKSEKIFYDEGGYKVKGTLQMHGISRQVVFPFKIERLSPETMAIQGNWTINRKAFHVIWNRVLDHGGILVSDDFNVNWRLHLRTTRKI